jgi:tetratricopeptide (TPR) repeat protein
MFEPRSKKLIRIEKLIKEGKKEEALERLLKYHGSAWTYFFGGAPAKGLEIALQCKDLIHKIGRPMDIAYNLFTTGHMYVSTGDNQTGLDYGLRCVELYEKLEGKGWIAAGLYLVGLGYHNNNEFDLALKYLKKGLAIKEISSDSKVNILVLLGNIYGMRGEFTQAIKYSEEGLKVSDDGEFNFQKSIFLFLLGAFLAYRGDFDKGFFYLKKNLVVAEKSNNINIHAFSLYSLTAMHIEKYVENNSFNQAKEYLNQLKELETRTDNKFVTYCYFITKGLVLNQSGRTRDRAEAETLFKKVVEDEVFITSSIQSLILSHYAFYFLCRLYLGELSMSNNLKIIDDINPLISLLVKHAKTFQSDLFLSEVKVFQSKLELIQMNFDEAKKLLTEAQQIAELRNMHIMAQIVSNEHDRLLEQQELWNNIEKTNAPFSERIKLASFDGILDRIQGKRLEDSPQLIPETPIFLLIFTESGTPLLSYSFSQELSFEDDIISSFISAFNTFSGELFSKGLDRARFGDYIILLESLNSFSICYLFKGQSYLAKQNLTSFIEKIKNNQTIRETLDKFYKTSQVAEVQNIPQIENLIKDIFNV